MTLFFRRPLVQQFDERSLKDQQKTIRDKYREIYRQRRIEGKGKTGYLSVGLQYFCG